MPMSPGGTVTPPSGTYGVTGQVIESAPYNSFVDDICSVVTSHVATDGRKAMTGVLAMGTNKITGGAPATAATDFAILSQVRDGISAHATSVTGTADALVLAFSPAITAWTNKTLVRWTSIGPNTIANPTIKFDTTLGTKTIKKNASVELAPGDTGAAGYICEGIYNGTDVLLLNPVTVEDIRYLADAATNTVSTALTTRHMTSGSVANGFGTSWLLTLENSTGVEKNAASIDFIWTDATNASEDVKISLKTMVAGAAKAEAAFIGAGMVIGAPTGGDKGAGTINATAIYKNGVSIDGIRCFASFDGGSPANVSATYARSGTTVTVTSAAHNHIVGHVVYADFTSGTATDGLFTITAVTTNTYDFTHGTSGATSGNVTLRRRNIFLSSGVHSVTYSATGEYYVNFTAAMPDTLYSSNTGVSGTANMLNIGATAKTAQSANLNAFTNAGVALDPAECNAWFLR